MFNHKYRKVDAVGPIGTHACRFLDDEWACNVNDVLHQMPEFRLADRRPCSQRSIFVALRMGLEHMGGCFVY